MSGALTVPESAKVTMTASGELRHLCPHREEADHGAITVIWRCAGATFELHELREYLDGFTNLVISHEELTSDIRKDLSGIPGIRLLSVETRWATAGMEVFCSTSPTPAGPKTET